MYSNGGSPEGKFSHLVPVCGGPVEVAVVTTDQPFRRVRQKTLDAQELAAKLPPGTQVEEPLCLGCCQKGE